MLKECENTDAIEDSKYNNIFRLEEEKGENRRFSDQMRLKTR
jgi:hypothetical protein